MEQLSIQLEYPSEHNIGMKFIQLYELMIFYDLLLYITFEFFIDSIYPEKLFLNTQYWKFVEDEDLLRHQSMKSKSY